MVEVMTQTGSQVQLFILVPFDFLYNLSSENVHEPDTRVICRDHSDVAIEKVNSSHFSTAGILTIVVSDLNYLFLLKFFVTIIIDHAYPIEKTDDDFI